MRNTTIHIIVIVSILVLGLSIFAFTVMNLQGKISQGNFEHLTGYAMYIFVFILFIIILILLSIFKPRIKEDS